jgi:hypothetical protein
LPRSAGRLTADLVRGIGASTVVLLAGIALGAHVQSGVLGAVAIVLIAALFGVAYAGFGILVALRTRNVQATQSSCLLFGRTRGHSHRTLPARDRDVRPVRKPVPGLRAAVTHGNHLKLVG